MSGLRFKLVATVAVVLAVSVSVTVAFAATPAAAPMDSAGDGPGRPAPGNSRESSAVLVARNVAPGDSRGGTVTITNRERVPASVTLSRPVLREEPGQGGGKLSAKLRLRVEEVTAEGAPTRLYGGAVGSMPGHRLGRFMPGESHTYRFAVSFPESQATSAQDNAYMGGSLRLDLHWRTSY